jgi:hypothetical protein
MKRRAITVSVSAAACTRSTFDRSRVTGVTITSHEGDDKRALTTDLVVDATGRGSRTPAFLECLGYDRPIEDEVVIRLVYASQLLRIPAGMQSGATETDALTLYSDHPALSRDQRRRRKPYGLPKPVGRRACLDATRQDRERPQWDGAVDRTPGHRQ